VDVEHEIRGVDERAQRARTAQLDRVARAVERRIGPDAVVVLVDVA
jgi:hypothetical protein